MQEQLYFYNVLVPTSFQISERTKENLIWYYFIFNPKSDVLSNSQSQIGLLHLYPEWKGQGFSESTNYSFWHCIIDLKLRTILISSSLSPLTRVRILLSHIHYFVGDTEILHTPSLWWLLDDVPVIHWCICSQIHSQPFLPLLFTFLKLPCPLASRQSLETEKVPL